jgi:hypothetical protein
MQSLLDSYGGMKLDSAPVPYGNQYGLQQRRDKLSALLGKNKEDKHGNPYYIFTDVSDTTPSGAQLLSDYSWRLDFLNHLASPFNRYTCPALHQFFVGGIGQGAPVHFHGTVRVHIMSCMPPECEYTSCHACPP